MARTGWSYQLSLLAIFSALAFLASLFVKITLSYGAIVYSIVLLTGALLMARPFSATAIAAISGLIYSFQSQLFLLMLGTFLVRGLALDLIFIPARVYERASAGSYSVPMIAAAMVTSGFLAGLYQYFFITLFLGKLIDFGAFLVSTIFLTSLVSNAIASYIVPRLLMPRLRGVWGGAPEAAAQG
ncbi:MAG: hypothetical protein BA066_06200 [Candidatus Korarchaeota archaeon NZ13-K]|nr:MAG: hypothetical protein BA066_06200 [Candidatus Korarchaeota archaeon NZ13-K]